MSSIITRYLRRRTAGAVVLRKGAVVSVTSIADEKQFDVTIASSKPIARGSTADIYVGKMFEEGRVALKVVTNTSSDDMAREQLLRREVRAAHQVRHPHILPLLGLAITEAHTIIVSPLMRNGNLVRYLKEHPAANRNILVLQVAEALNHLHAVHGLVHGDMKCENVLISDEGTALLTDFGLSTFVDKSKTFIGPPIATNVLPSVNLQDILSLTLPEVRLLYTPEFAGPELLFSGDAQATEQLPSKNMELDVYAFGMLMIQVFSGEPPWPGCTPQAIVLKIYSKAIHPHPGPAAVSRGLTDAWWQHCLGCLEYEPQRRPSMGRLLADLTASHRAYDFVQSYLRSSSEAAPNDEPRDPVALLLGPLVSEPRWLEGNRKAVVAEVARQLEEQMKSSSPLAKRSIAHLRILQEALNGGLCQTTESIANSPTYETARHVINAHEDVITSLAFVSGSLAISGSWDETLRVWDTNTGEAVGAPLEGHEAGISCIDVSRDATHVASITTTGQTIRIWTFDAGRFVNAGPVLRVQDIQSVVFSPNGGHLICGSHHGPLLVFDMMTGDQMGEPGLGHTGGIRAVMFSPDGKRLISGSNDTTIRVWAWDGLSTTVVPIGDPLTAHAGSVHSVAASPDGKVFASGSRDNTVRIWDADAQRLKLTLLGHTLGINCVVFSPNSKLVASGGSDSTVRLWNVSSGETVSVLTRHGNWVRALAFSPDGLRFVSGSSDRTLITWDHV